MIAPSRYLSKLPVSRALRCGTLTLLMLVAAALSAQNAPVDDFRCPESYATDAEREAALKAFVEKFAKQHPQAALDDLLAERYRLLIAHDCRQTLVNLAGNRKGDKVAPQLVMPRAQSLILAGHKFSRVDEYYDVKTRVWNIIFVDDPQHPESYGNQLILNFYNWTPEPTAEAVASTLSQERQGAKTISLFKAPGEPGGEMVYHLVSLTRGRANFVNVISIAGWERSAVTISFGHRLGAGVDLGKMEAEARLWLLSAEGEALRNAVAGLRVGAGWREYLKQVK
jgi:hypothetical protein